MAYSRWSECDWYIYGCDENDGVLFSGPPEESIFVPGDAIDIFIYKLFEEEAGGGEDFWERFARGKRLVEEGMEQRAKKKQSHDEP